MRATLVVLAIAGAVLVGATHASARVACRPGITAGGGRKYCGPAKATLKDGGKKYVFNQGGNCKFLGSNFALNIGTITVVGTPKHAYFGITVFSKKAGKHSAAVSWQLHGKTKSLSNGVVTLARGLKRGTFTGSNGRRGRKASGSFSCK
jgi:hypothetical protein